MRFNWCIFLILLLFGIIPGIIYAIICEKEKGIPITPQVVVNIQQPTIIQKPLTIVYCSKCGSQNDSRNKFCENCGVIINH